MSLWFGQIAMGYTLIITEKPDAALRIASALDAQGKARRMRANGVPYYVAKREKEIVVVPTIGHFYAVAEERGARDHYPVFTFRWLPKYMVEKNAKHVRIWLETISKLSDDADTFIDACDYDIEGSIIGYCILKYACGNKETVSKRMKYSTLTTEELEKSYAEILPNLDFALVEAGRARHEVDWFYGINLSRALTIAARECGGKHSTLSTGRVQGPTLRFLVSREKVIRFFVPTPYWSIKAEVDIAGSIFEVEYEKKIIKSKIEANATVDACKEKKGIVKKVEVKQIRRMPPAPFDLGTLQSEVYSVLGYTPMRTSAIAQRLYLDALISYPRTSSQKLPPAINYRAILTNLSKTQEYKKLAAELLAKSELKPSEGKKDDPAHPAIYPTGNLPERALDGSERNLLDIIIRRFMAVFGEPAIMQSIKAYISINGHSFYLRGRQTLKEGWLRFYKPYVRSEEVLLPEIEQEQAISVRKVISEDKFTKPPPRYNPGSLLKRMEEAGIGTKATRSSIIQKLCDRRYVREERMVVTDLGFEVLEVLEKYCPSVVSIKLSRELEEKMDRVQLKSEKREVVLLDAVEMLKPIMEELKSREKIIGDQLSDAIRKVGLEERTIGMCPICKTGKLMVLYSRKTGKRFVGCTNYFKRQCNASFPLPQRGTVRSLHRSCRGCGWPTVLVRIKGGRPWTLCLNPKCPLKWERRKRIEMQNMR
jgi:DNA topoisomerase-1